MIKSNFFKITKFSLFTIFCFYLLLVLGNWVVDAFNDSELNVYFDNLSYNNYGNAMITKSKKDINFNCNLANVNDKFVIMFDVINNSKNDAIVDIFKLNGINDKNDKFLDYYIVYEDNSVINEGDILKAGTSKKIKLVVSYTLDKDITLSELPDENTKLNLGFQLYFGQKLK